MSVKKKKNIKRQNLIQLGLSLVFIILLNIVGSFVFTRFDLTSEKRYTLSDATKKMLKNLDDIVYFKIYLEGDFPAGFKRLHKETQEMLDEFRAYSKNVQYEFINPSANPNKKIVENLYKQLMTKGLTPTNLQVKTKEGSSQQIIFPGAIVSYEERDVPLTLLNSQVGVPAEEVLNNSIQALEYNIASAIKKLTVKEKPSVAFIEGHGELDPLRVADIAWALSEYYNVARVRIDGKINSLTKREQKKEDTTKTIIANKYKAIIIAKPDSAFSEKDKFIIDQFIMHGGKVLWLIDPVFASMDSLQKSYETISMPMDLNLEDLLFKYGVRLNTNLVLDLNALPIPVVTGQVGDRPQQSLMPWFYFPLITPTINHPIVNNLNAIKTDFVSSIDTVGASGVRKTILLQTSKYSRIINAPSPISLDIVMKEPDVRLYSKPPQAVAVLLEGRFESAFTHRVLPQISNNKDMGFLEKSKPTAMVVISDGDVIRNQYRIEKGQPVPLPLGFDKYTNQTFGNRDLILNIMNYLCDDSGLITIRSRELKLRLLDNTVLDEDSLYWQVLNTVLPILLVIFFGIIQFFLRKRKYTKIA